MSMFLFMSDAHDFCLDTDLAMFLSTEQLKHTKTTKKIET
jgi:hypothetical protein